MSLFDNQMKSPFNDLPSHDCNDRTQFLIIHSQVRSHFGTRRNYLKKIVFFNFVCDISTRFSVKSNVSKAQGFFSFYFSPIEFSCIYQKTCRKLFSKIC